ncbi:GNAT family N-acetyltransferase [Paraburkholderia sp. BCC1885]|uniref:GNAT family N-acetyltransferase n=1 Tax=Paraburkholderia sp. BCC1885 TaxID=2562669 RepID=UPI0011844CAF|nr:GNAT family N-acetyltransferase [Paraburkholderia sp. BCC1885]
MSEADVQANAVGTHPLDAVIWNALTTRQRRFAAVESKAVRFTGDIAPFGALADLSQEAFADLRLLIEAQGPAALVTTSAFALPAGFAVVRSGALLQMIWQGELEPQNDFEHVILTEADTPEMLALTTATQPGPFGPRTVELGTYLGVRREGKLAAMAGERLSFDGFTEISAVCTDPAFRGKGFAASLMKLLISTITARGETPFLHVFSSNENAIRIYRALGFVDRREMHLNVLGVA